MKIDTNNLKLITILGTLFYIFGILAQFYSLKIIFSFAVAIILTFLLLVINLNFKKCLILLFIFVLGFFRAQNCSNFDNKLEKIIANDVVLKGQIITSKDVSTKYNKLSFYLRTQNAQI